MLRSIIKFARVRIIVSCYAVAYIGAIAAGGITIKTLLVLLVITAWYVHASTSNDYADRYIDRINLTKADNRPLMSGDISHQQLWIIHAVSAVLALLGASFYGRASLLAMFGMLLTDYLYSFKPFYIAGRGLASQLLLGIAYAWYPFSLGYWSADQPRSYHILLGLGLYSAFVGRVLLKDFRDVKGDKKHGKLTFVLRHGVRATCIVSAICWVVALLCIGAATKFAPGLLIVLLMGVIYVLLLLKKIAATSRIPEQLVVVQLIAKAANIQVIAIMAYLLCRNAHLQALRMQLITVSIGAALLTLNQLRARRLAP